MTKIKISNSGRGTFLDYKFDKQGFIKGRVINNAGLYGKSKTLKVYTSSKGKYVNIAGIGRCYL